MKNINNKSINFGLKMLTILAFGLMFVPFNEAAAGMTYVYGHDNVDGSYTFGDFVYGNPSTNGTNNPQPSVSSINPKSSNLGVGTKTVTITGSGFVPSSVARVNGSNRPTTFIDNSHLLVQITGNDTYTYSANGGFYITVFNGAPGGGYSNSAFFTVNQNTNTNTNTNSNSTPDNFTDTVQNNNTTNTNGNNDNYSNLASNAIFGSNSFLPSGLTQWVILAIIILVIIIIVRKLFGGTKNYNEAPMKHD